MMKKLFLLLCFPFLASAVERTYLVDRPQLRDAVETAIDERSKRTGYPIFSAAVAKLENIRVLEIGDSVAENGETPQGLRGDMVANYGRGGFGSFYNNSYWVDGEETLPFYGDTTATYTTSPLSIRSAFYFANGNILTTSNASGGGVYANKLSIDYYGFAAGGSLLIETQKVGGAFATFRTLDATSATGYAITNFSLPSDFHNVRLTATGSNIVFNVGLQDTNANAMNWAKYTVPGALLSGVVTNFGFASFYTNYNPQLVIVEVKDPATSLIDGLNKLTALVTNSDIIFVTSSPNTDDDDIPAAAVAGRRWAATNFVNCFDKFALFPSYDSQFYSDTAHLNEAGTRKTATAFASWFNFNSYRIRPKTNVFYLSALDVRLQASGALQTTEPVMPNEIYYGGLTLFQHGHYMASGTPRQIFAYAPSSFFAGKYNWAITQRWLTTNLQVVTFGAVANRLNFSDVNLRTRVGTDATAVTQTLSGTNILTTRYAGTLGPIPRSDDIIGLYMGWGTSGSLTNSIWWMGAKIEAW